MIDTFNIRLVLILLYIIRRNIDLRYSRSLNSYQGTEQEKLREEYMHNKLLKSSRIPMVVKGDGPKGHSKNGRLKNKIKL